MAKKGNEPPTTKAPFGSRLRRFRENAGLTQEELASRADLSAKTVSALERGERGSFHEQAVASTRSRLGELAFEEARAEGRALGFEEAVEYALESVEGPGTAAH